MSKFVIIDQNLSGFVGHYWEYDSAVAKLFSERGHDVTLLAKKNVSSHLSADFVKVVPWFSYSSGDVYRPGLYRILVDRFGLLPKPVLAALKAGYRGYKYLRGGGVAPAAEAPSFARECVAAIGEFGLGGNDTVFIETIYMAELRSLAKALVGTDAKNCPRILIVLRREPEEPNMAGFAEVLQTLAGLYGKKLFFFADTQALAEAYHQLYGIEVGLLPVICDIPLIRRLAVAPTQAHKSPRKLAYLGSARIEKGFDLLPGLIAELAQRYPRYSDLEFHIQTYIPPDEYDAGVAAAIAQLKQLGQKVVLYPDALSQGAYIELLTQSDMILLPYDAAAYKRRSSGILIQALTAGKVTIIPDHTGLSSSIPTDATQRFSPGKLADAALEALESFDALETSAKQYGKHMSFDNVLNQFYRALTGVAASE